MGSVGRRFAQPAPSQDRPDARDEDGLSDVEWKDALVFGMSRRFRRVPAPVDTGAAARCPSVPRLWSPSDG